MNQTRIFLSPPHVGDVEEKRVGGAIRSGWVAPVGPELDKFEQMVAELAHRDFAVALSSGTSALHLGLLSLGVRPGDVVICSTLTFVATANAISYVGAIPVFVDSDESTGNLSVALLSEAISALVSSRKKIAAVIPVDFLGSVANYGEILPLCARFDIPVLADSAESVGATSEGQPAGSFGEAAIFSFNGNKIVTTSGGGAFLTNDAEKARTVRHLSAHARATAIHYEHEVLGYNYRLSNVLASIGIVQIQRLDYLMGRRRENRARYRALFEGVDGVTILGANDSSDNCWLTAVVVDPNAAGFSSNQLACFLEQENIETRPLWKPMHLQPLYKSCKSYLSGAGELLFQRGLALPSGSGLGEPEWQRITGAIHAFLSQTK